MCGIWRSKRIVPTSSGTLTLNPITKTSTKNILAVLMRRNPSHPRYITDAGTDRRQQFCAESKFTSLFFWQGKQRASLRSNYSALTKQDSSEGELEVGLFMIFPSSPEHTAT